MDNNSKLRILRDIKQNKYVPFVTEVEKFNNSMGKPNNNTPNIPNIKAWEFVYNFIIEENNEYKEACIDKDIVGVLDALCDIIYVGVGNLAMLHGLKDKLIPAYAEVQASNMSKSCTTEEEAAETVKERSEELQVDCHYEKVGMHWVVYRSSDKKVMKSIKYFAPNLKQFFTQQELDNIK